MSRVAIRGALETALNAMSPALSAAFENVAFTPTPGTPYQAVHVMFARPVNNEFSANYRQDGILQVTLRYPANAGPGAAAARAELIASTFKRGNSFTSGGVTVLITDQAEVMPGFNDADRWAVPLRVRFTAHVTAA
jgi:hypothetical protein